MIIARIPADQLRNGELVRVAHPPFDILVANVDGVLHAIEDACPHSGRSLSDGHIEGCSVVCPGHGYRINIVTGCVETPAGEGLSNTRYRVELVGAEILVHASAA